MIKYGMLLFFSAMTCAMLLKSRMAAALALEGLSLWFSKMIPALLPFMILSGLLMELGLSDSFASLFAPILRPILRLSDSCLYCVIIGFLCGFPMGARVCAQSYAAGKLSRREASLLLVFCNNIGPVYFTGFFLHLFPSLQPMRAVLIMYGIPFLYGVLLRYTLFRDVPAPEVRRGMLPRISGTDVRRFTLRASGANAKRFTLRAPAADAGRFTLRASGANAKRFTLRAPAANAGRLTPERILLALNTSIQSGLDAVTVLGGYMIFCNMLNLFPRLLLPADSRLSLLIGPALEITSGLSRLPQGEAAAALALLPLGGLSCIAQTCSCIRDTDLSLREYVFHKAVQTVLTLACCGLAV